MCHFNFLVLQLATLPGTQLGVVHLGDVQGKGPLRRHLAHNLMEDDFFFDPLVLFILTLFNLTACTRSFVQFS